MKREMLGTHAYGFATPDHLYIESGGSMVATLECDVIRSIAEKEGRGTVRWKQIDDEELLYSVKECERRFKAFHFYSGSYPNTVRYLKSKGTIVSHTIDAHDRFESRKAHEEVGIPFSYPHLVQEDLWKEYSHGIMESDFIIVPGEAPRRTMESFGYQGALRIVPHCYDAKRLQTSLNKKFRIGYLGAFGADKGIFRYFQAIHMLKVMVPGVYNKCQFVFAGKHWNPEGKETLLPDIHENCEFLGWQEDVGAFYNSLDLYIQPSITEGFGIEVVEALASCVPVLCSTEAGAFNGSCMYALNPTNPGLMMGSILQTLGHLAPFITNNELEDTYSEKAVINKYKQVFQEFWSNE